MHLALAPSLAFPILLPSKGPNTQLAASYHYSENGSFGNGSSSNAPPSPKCLVSKALWSVCLSSFILPPYRPGSLETIPFTPPFINWLGGQGEEIRQGTDNCLWEKEKAMGIGKIKTELILKGTITSRDWRQLWLRVVTKGTAIPILGGVGGGKRRD